MSSPRLELGVLDFCKILGAPVHGGNRTAPQVLRETIELARMVDQLGFSRYWLAEHHTPDAASSSPEMLLPAIAANTSRIRVGTGGVLLPYYSSLKVAKNFRLLEAMFPGRIDLGVARGLGTGEREISLALADGREDALARDSFARKVRDLHAHLSGGFAPDHAWKDVRATPVGGNAPPLWLLAFGGPETMQMAGELGANVSIGHFLYRLQNKMPDIARDVANLERHYVSNFRPTPANPRPRFNVAIQVMCAPTEAEARRLDERNLPMGWWRHDVVGTPAQCKAGIEEIARLHGTREVIIANNTPDPRARRRSYELVARAFGMGAQVAPARSPNKRK